LATPLSLYKIFIAPKQTLLDFVLAYFFPAIVVFLTRVIFAKLLIIGDLAKKFLGFAYNKIGFCFASLPVVNEV